MKLNYKFYGAITQEYKIIGGWRFQGSLKTIKNHEQKYQRRKCTFKIMKLQFYKNMQITLMVLLYAYCVCILVLFCAACCVCMLYMYNICGRYTIIYKKYEYLKVYIVVCLLIL